MGSGRAVSPVFLEDFVVSSCVPTYYCSSGPILILTLRTRNKHSWMGLSFLWTRKFVSQSWGFFESHCRSPNVCLKCLNCIFEHFSCRGRVRWEGGVGPPGRGRGGAGLHRPPELRDLGESRKCSSNRIWESVPVETKIVRMRKIALAKPSASFYNS